MEIKGGETKELFLGSVPVIDLSRVDVDLQASCSCGGKMIKVKDKLEWLCEYDQWWRFWNRKHAHLVATLQTSYTPPIDSKWVQ